LHDTEVFAFRAAGLRPSSCFTLALRSASAGLVVTLFTHRWSCGTVTVCWVDTRLLFRGLSLERPADLTVSYQPSHSCTLYGQRTPARHKCTIPIDVAVRFDLYAQATGQTDQQLLGPRFRTRGEGDQVDPDQAALVRDTGGQACTLIDAMTAEQGRHNLRPANVPG
jgi:hypothetical protein